MAIIDQSEIDALLAEASALADEADATSEKGGSAQHAAPPQPVRRLPKDPKLRRVLRVRVPVVAELARRMMSIAGVRRLAVGSIIEFEKNVEDDLQLRVNKRLIARGVCVKVGEHFGLRLTAICSPQDRVHAMAES